MLTVFRHSCAALQHEGYSRRFRLYGLAGELLIESNRIPLSPGGFGSSLPCPRRPPPPLAPPLENFGGLPGAPTGDPAAAHQPCGSTPALRQHTNPAVAHRPCRSTPALRCQADPAVTRLLAPLAVRTACQVTPGSRLSAGREFGIERSHFWAYPPFALVEFRHPDRSVACTGWLP